MINGLMGKTYNTLDGKGRFIVPVKYRTSLGDEFVMCQGVDHNILAYPAAEWEKFAEKLSGLSTIDERTRRFREYFEGSACVCETDGQSRATIPQQLREFAGIDKEVVIVGHTTHCAIWSREAWDRVHGDALDMQGIFAYVGEHYDI